MILWRPGRKIKLDGALCVGNFDGFHLGHRKIIEAAKRKSRKCFATMFFPHPRLIINPENFFVITPLIERERIMKDAGVEEIILIPFLEVKDMLPEEFVKEILDCFSPTAIFVGEDFKFGKGASGSSEDLKKLAPNTNVMPIVEINGRKVSSSLIRRKIMDGEVHAVKDLADRYYRVRGLVVPGSGRGRTLNFPTANISTTFTLPPDGVYACRVSAESRLEMGVCHIGPKPTFSELKKTFEIFIIDSSPNLYGRCLEVEFIKKIRNIMNFSSPDRLRERIEADINEAIKILECV